MADPAPLNAPPPRASTLTHLRSLRPREALLLVQMVAMIAALKVLQRFVSLPTLIRLFDVPRPHPEQRLHPKRLAWLASGLLRRLFGQDYCMPRSLVLFHFMRKWAYPVQIHFGVAMREGELKGHAWVTLGDLPFAERGDPRRSYKTMYSYPSDVS